MDQSTGDANSAGNVSQTLFPDSPVYEPEEDLDANSGPKDEVWNEKLISFTFN